MAEEPVGKVTDEEPEGETSEEEGSEEDQGEETPSDDDASEEEGEQEPEYFDSEEEYLSQFELPGKPKSVEQLVQAHTEAIKELNRLQREKAEPPKPRTPAPETVPDVDSDGRKTYFKRDQFRQRVKAMSDGAMFTDEAHEKTYKSVANLLDPVFNGFMEQVEAYYGAQSKTVTAMLPALRRLSWQGFTHKDVVPKRDLDSFMDQYGLYEYDQALRAMAVEDPNIFTRIAQAAHNTGKDRERKKMRFRRAKGERRSPTVSRKGVYGPYLNAAGDDLDVAKMQKLGMEQIRKVRTAYEKDQQSGRLSTRGR